MSDFTLEIVVPSGFEMKTIRARENGDSVPFLGQLSTAQVGFPKALRISLHLYKVVIASLWEIRKNRENRSRVRHNKQQFILPLPKNDLL